MNITTLNRSDLKKYFVKNAIPTESSFAELIDAGLIQRDDGIAKPPGDPLSIEASGDATSQRMVLNLYEDFTDLSATWVLSLNPRGDPADPATARAGFSISDGAGNSRLFIDKASGNVGVGTVNPDNALEVNGAIEIQTDNADSKLRFHAPSAAWYSMGIDRSDSVKFKINYGPDVGSADHFAMDPSGNVSIAQEAWIPAEFEGTWENVSSTYNPCAYFKDSMGVVHLRGGIKNNIAGKASIFTLPIGYRPANREMHMTYTSTVQIDATGLVSLPSGNNNFLSLDGITFRAV